MKTNNFRVTRPATVKALISLYNELGHPVETECRVTDDGSKEFDEIWNIAHMTFYEKSMRSKKTTLVDSDSIKAGDYIIDSAGCISYVIMRSKSDNTVYLRKKLLRGGFILVRQNLSPKIELIEDQ